MSVPIARPLIALLTDFGLEDHYVGVMKGVMLGICRDARLVDITHHVPAQDIGSAIRTLDESYRFFPPGTVFLGVVDPGVGSERRGLALEVDGHYFVGPDNGLFSQVIARARTAPQIVELASQAHALPEISRTFEGRDRFAPAAAWLASGVALSALGRPLSSIVSFDLPEARVADTIISGAVVAVDHFGNLITNIAGAMVDRLQPPHMVTVNGEAVSAIVKNYAEVSAGTVCALIGSGGSLEIAVRNGSAARVLGAERGTTVQVHTRA